MSDFKHKRDVLQHSVCQLHPFHPNAFKIRAFKLVNGDVQQCSFVFLIISGAKEMTNTNLSTGGAFPLCITTVDKALLTRFVRIKDQWVDY